MTARTRSGKSLSIGKTTYTAPYNCLGCGKELDAATGVGHRRKPRAGTIMVCLDCGHLAAFDSQLKMRPLTDEEIVTMAGNEQVIAIQKARAKIRLARSLGLLE